MSRRSATPSGRIYGPEPWAVVRGVELSHWDLWFVVVMSSLSGGKRELVELLKSRRHDVEAIVLSSVTWLAMVLGLSSSFSLM